MKNIFTHFKMSIIFGMLLIATFTSQHTISVLAEMTNLIVDSGANSSTDDNFSDPDPDTDSAPDVDEAMEPLPEIPSSPDTPLDKFNFPFALIIKAVNPGYTVDGTQNVGEFIELQNVTDASLSLANYSIRYTTSSGKSTVLLDFSEGSSLVGEFLLMRLARSPDSEMSDATYMTTLAMGAGTVEILYYDEVVDSVCWASKSEKCSDPFKSASPTTLVRDIATGDFEHLSDYLPNFTPESPSLIIIPPEPSTAPDQPDSSGENSSSNHLTPDDFNSDDLDVEPVSARCYGLEFSEILSYYANDKTEQFIELYNPTEHDIDLSFCMLRYKNKSYSFSGIIASNSYFAIYPTTFSPSLSLTKNPNSSNTLELIDADDSLVDILVYSHGQKKSTSYAKFYDSTGAEIWELTYSVTPGLENNYQEFQSCLEGKVINPDTGNCVKVSSSTDGTPVECPAGKYRNPLTGRCKNIESDTTELKPCSAGYERNPETNRCRKIVAENDGAGYAIVPTTSSSKSTFIALGAVLLIVSLGVIYIIFQFRHEIVHLVRKIKQRLHHVR